jgi:hypothetical protein
LLDREELDTRRRRRVSTRPRQPGAHFVRGEE